MPPFLFLRIRLDPRGSYAELTTLSGHVADSGWEGMKPWREAIAEVMPAIEMTIASLTPASLSVEVMR